MIGIRFSSPDSYEVWLLNPKSRPIVTHGYQFMAVPTTFLGGKRPLANKYNGNFHAIVDKPELVAPTLHRMSSAWFAEKHAEINNKQVQFQTEIAPLGDINGELIAAGALHPEEQFDLPEETEGLGPGRYTALRMSDWELDGFVGKLVIYRRGADENYYIEPSTPVRPLNEVEQFAG
jgi:hypothetical protein